MSNKFRLHVPAVKPGDFGPSGLAVYSEQGQCVVIRDGALVTSLGPVWDETEDAGLADECVISYRKVRTEDGFEGTVCWCGFESV